MSEPSRVPSVVEIRDVYETLWAFFLRNSWRCGKVRDQEDEFLPLFSRLSDALHAVRPLAESVQGWPNAVTRALFIAIENFDGIAADWGWEEIAKPEPNRSSYIEGRRKDFQEEFQRPYFEAVISWQEGWRILEFDSSYDQDAEYGRSLGFGPAMTPEEGKTLLIPRLDVLLRTPCLGTTYPTIGDGRLGGLHRAFNLLEGATLPDRTPHTWSPRHQVENPANDPAPTSPSPVVHTFPDASSEHGRSDQPSASKRRQGGRPSDTDPVQDAKIANAWASKAHRTYEDLARSFRMKPLEVRQALDRHRKRAGKTPSKN